MTSEQLNKQRIREEIERLQLDNNSRRIVLESIDTIISNLLGEAEDNSSIIDTNTKRIEALEQTL